MKKFITSFWSIFLFFLLLRLLPYLFDQTPRGYDAGIYLYLFKHFPDLPQWLLTGFSPALFVIVYPIIKIGISPELLLIPLSISSQIILFISIYIISVKFTDNKIALWNIFILTASAIQFRTFWFFYLRNSFALAFLLFALYFLQKKYFKLAVLFASLVGLFHLPTFLLLFLILTTIIIIDKNKLYYCKVLLLIIFINAVYYLPQYNYILQPYISPLLHSLLAVKLLTSGADEIIGGTFYNNLTSLFLTMYYLPFSLVGVYSCIRNKSLHFFTAGFIITASLIISKFFFFQRYFITLDIFLIFFSGIGFEYVYHNYKKNDLMKEIFYIYPLFIIIFIIGFVFKTQQPLLTQQDINEIKQFNQNYKQAYILSTAKEDHAWLLGYTNDPIIAFGFGSNDIYWNEKDWNIFYLTRNEKERLLLLKKLPQPLYIYINDKTLHTYPDLIKTPRIKKHSEHIYSFICSK